MSLALPHAQSAAQTAIQPGGQTQRAPSSDSSPAFSSSPVSTDLPDSPGTVLRRRIPASPAGDETASISNSGIAITTDSDQSPSAQQPQPPAALTAAEARASDTPAGCLAFPASSTARPPANGSVESTDAGALAPPTQPSAPCPPAQNPYQRFLNSTAPIPLTPKQKAYLAVHNFIEPGNIVTVLGTSGIAIASDSHTAYGPGWRGFGRNAGISFVQDATGDFFGTFLIPSATHEDPHYHRMPNASITRRTLHAISRTVIAQSDFGRPMPNYATLLTYPITAEIANLYVPGVATNGPSTARRILTGYATDPIDNLITEFLPDVAKRIHVRVIFVQQIINQVAAGQTVNMFP